MRCPRCGSELHRTTGGGYRCPAGCGQFLTLAALRAAGAPGQLTAELWRNARIGNTIPGLPCPNCRRTMQQLKLGDGNVTFDLDICTGCQSLWFDAGEFEHLGLPVEPPPAPPRPELKDLRPITAGYDHLPDSDDLTLRTILPALLGLPVEQYPRKLSRLPFVTWGLALLCLAVHGVLLWRGELASAIADWGMIPDQWQRHHGLTLLSSMFLHAGILHLLGNVYFLLMCGDDAEDVLGHGGYILLVLLSGLSADMLHTLSGGAPGIPCVGASGFISGILAFYAMTFPRATIGIYLWSRPGGILFAMHRFRLNLPAWGWFAIYVIIQLSAAWLDRSGRIAYFAHLGGIIPGVVFAVLNRCGRDVPDVVAPNGNGNHIIGKTS